MREIASLLTLAFLVFVLFAWQESAVLVFPPCPETPDRIMVCAK